MPSLFDPDFAAFVRSVPVLPHSVEVEAAFWRPKFKAAGLSEVHDSIFAGEPIIRISRDRLLNHDFGGTVQKCAEILLWGYPKDLKGIASRLLPHLGSLASASQAKVTWKIYIKGFPKGAGASTITKLGYFFGCSFNGRQALILDNRIVKQVPRWEPLSGMKVSTSFQMYPEYLDVMHEAAKKIGCSGEQLELFLFSQGSNY
jgi:hypothetical protein